MATNMISVLVFLTVLVHSVTAKVISYDDIEKMKNNSDYKLLYNFYEKLPQCDGTNDYSVLLWGTHCVMLCDGSGRTQILDRDKNKYDTGLGDRALEEANSGDKHQLTGDPCDLPKSVIAYEENEDYVRICNEQGKTEIMSKTYSACPSGSHEQQVTVDNPEGYAKPCNGFDVNLKHNEAKRFETNVEGICNVLYCCNGDLLHTNGENCDAEIQCVEVGQIPRVSSFQPAIRIRIGPLVSIVIWCVGSYYIRQNVLLSRRYRRVKWEDNPDKYTILLSK